MMKQLIPLNFIHPVLALNGFSIECNPIEIASRIKALSNRLSELIVQIAQLQRAGDRDEAKDLSQYYDDLTEQQYVVKKIFKSSRNTRESMYAEFYSRHGHEAPNKP